MPRAKGGFKQRRAHKKVLKLTKGFRMSRNRLFRSARAAAVKAGAQSFKGRRQRRREIKRLWITRISGALVKHEIMYSRFMNALAKANLGLNRKMLAELAARDEAGFDKVVAQVKEYLK